MKRALLLVPLLTLALPGTAVAETPAQVAAALKASPVYQAEGLDLVDVPTLRAELAGGDPQLDVAVLPASAATSAEQARLRAVEIGRALADRNVVVLVITANRHFGAGAGSGAVGRGVQAGQALAAELAETAGQAFSKDNLTAFVTSYQQRLAAQVSGGSGAGGDGAQDGGGDGGVYLLGGLLLVAGGVTAFAIRSSRNRKRRLNEGLRADVEQLYNRLGSDVASLDPGDNVVARQALADAAERYNACGATLAAADAPAEFAAARRTAVEGLTAARTARTQLGLDPGPEIPLVGGAGPQLETDQQVSLAGKTFDGSPSYQPGRQHYYGGGTVGGQNVPGGWYSMPFWEPFLLGSILTGGLGGFGGGGAFERGYEAGQEAGHEAGHGEAERQDAGGDSSGGGDWGGSSNGDSGGGDWGGDSGGDSGGDW